jgi:hypothetical protein
MSVKSLKLSANLMDRADVRLKIHDVKDTNEIETRF